MVRASHWSRDSETIETWRAGSASQSSPDPKHVSICVAISALLNSQEWVTNLLALVRLSTHGSGIRYRLRAVTFLSVTVGYGPLVPAMDGMDGVDKAMRSVSNRPNNEVIMWTF